jgi:hypothetical protein
MLTDPTWYANESRRLIEESRTLIALGRLQAAKSWALIAESNRACAVVAPRHPATDPLVDQLADR